VSVGTDPLGAQLPGAAGGGASGGLRFAWGEVVGTAGGTVAVDEVVTATGGGKPLKVEAQGRYRHETRPERFRAEQSVERSRKPEDAAQPGEVSPVWVAARCRKRRRAAKPHGSVAGARQVVRGRSGRWQAFSSSSLDVS
jgi:hypothetical protein